MNANRGYDAERDKESMEIKRYWRIECECEWVRFCSIIVGADAITIASAAKVAVTITVDFMCKEKVKKRKFNAFYSHRFPIYCILEYFATCVHIFPII